MPVRVQDLARDLERGLKPAYLISGDEMLLVQEACDSIIAAARRNGFEERELIQADADFDWNELTAQANTMSLFTPRRLLDVRVSPKGLDKEAGEVLLGLLEDPSPDTLLLVRTERLEGAKRNAAWFKRIEAVGTVVLVWPVAPKEMPGWLAQRARRAGLELDRDALGYLANSVEGNLLAAAQEIEKLALAGLPQPVTRAALTSAITDAAHYDAFDLVDAALDAEPQRVRHIVWVLRAEGVQVLAVLGALTSQLRRLINDDSRGLPQQKERAMRAARKRLKTLEIEALLGLASCVDQQVKGVAIGNPWSTLECIALRMAGVAAIEWLAANEPLAVN
jgi:DNA polymerase-3 subunit delta